MDTVAMQETHPVTPSPSERGRVLIADDQRHIVDALQMLLRGCGFATEAVPHPARVLPALETGQFDAVLMDLNYTRGTVEGGEGLELVSRIRCLDSLLPVVVMTAWSSVDLAVEAMPRRFGLYPEALGESGASAKIAEPTVAGTDAAAGATAGR
jgi:CheY-like chemotaxis protein